MFLIPVQGLFTCLCFDLIVIVVAVLARKLDYYGALKFWQLVLFKNQFLALSLLLSSLKDGIFFFE